MRARSDNYPGDEKARGFIPNNALRTLSGMKEAKISSRWLSEARDRDEEAWDFIPV